MIPSGKQHGGMRPTLTTLRVTFLIVAAVAPMAGIVGSVPLAFALGNGAGVPAAFLLAGLTLLCFSVGYAAVSRHVVNTGGFYTYVTRGLGRTAGVPAGFLAVIAYNTLTVGVTGAFSYFAQLIAASYGVHAPWEVWAAIGIALTGFMGYRQIDLSARILGVLTVSEIMILVVIAVAIIARKGGTALPLAAFSPSHVLTGGLGIGLMFALISFTGFEEAALYGEEVRNPRRSIANATYLTVALLTLFFAGVSWAAVGAVGLRNLGEVASRELGNMFINLAGQYVGGAAMATVQILLCTSLFGAMLGLHNGASRYLYVLGRDQILPARLAELHPRHASPYRASLLQATVTSVICGAFALANLNPYTSLATSMLALGTVSLISLQAIVTVSVIVFFWRRPDRNWWRSIVAPTLALLGLGLEIVLLLRNYPIVTGAKSPLVNGLPWLLVVAIAGGIILAVWVKTKFPERYSAIGGEAAEKHVEKGYVSHA